MDVSPEIEAEWEIRAHQWVNQNRRRYCPEHTTKITSQQGLTKDHMPAEYLRKIVREHGDMSNKRFQKERSTHVMALKQSMYAMYKLWENMPMPWEGERRVNVLFHQTGAITMVTDTPRVIPPVFYAQWGAAWIRMRKEKLDRGTKFLRFVAGDKPIFDNDEPFIEMDTLLDQPDREGIQLFELSDEDEALIGKYWTEPIGDVEVGKRYWRLPIESLIALHGFGRVLLSDQVDPNYYYLFDKESFFTAKALNIAIPGYPKYEPIYRDINPDEDWTEFNDLNKVIRRQPLKSEVQIAFPHMYNQRPRRVAIAPYHSPPLLYLRSTNPELPTFSYDPVLAPVPPTPCYDPPIEDTSDFDLPSDFTPFLYDVPLDGPSTSGALELYWAPEPFCHRSGPMETIMDVSLVQSWFREHCPSEHPIKVKGSYQKLLKAWVANELRVIKRQRGEDTAQTKARRKNLFEQLAETKFYQTTSIDWVEAGLQLCRQVHNMLKLMLLRKGLDYLHLDYNFNLRPMKTLTTKQRKKSRLGPAIHLPREFMKLTKMVLDCHVKHRLGEIDGFQLADGLNYIFTHVATLTGLYRYKYRTLRQVRRNKDMKHLLYYRFNTGGVGKGPGMGFWEPTWRTWVYLLRGMTPLLQRYIENALSREFEGRRIKGRAKKITKQRTESKYDLEQKGRLRAAIRDILPEGMLNATIKRIEQHYSEAWRCFKANKDWNVPGMPAVIDKLIRRFVKEKADWWTEIAHANRARMVEGHVVDKVTVRKNHGRLVRLQLIAEEERQKSYLRHGSPLAKEDAENMYVNLAEWLFNRKYQPIPFPPVHYKYDSILLQLTLDALKTNQGEATTQTDAAGRLERTRIEYALDHPQETLLKIKQSLQQKRNFKTVEIEYVDYFTHLVPIFDIDPDEKICDLFLTQYLFLQAHSHKLFPIWVKPTDDLPNPARVYRWCSEINKLTDIWNTSEGECVAYVETKLDRLSENVDFDTLGRMLRLVMDPHLAGYLVSKNNVKIEYKDMSYVNHIGLLRGLQFAPFLIQFWGMAVDLSILGIERAADIQGDPNIPPIGHRQFAEYPDATIETRHPLRLYMRYVDRVHIVYRFTHAQAADLRNEYRRCQQENHQEALGIEGYPTKKCWSRDSRMRLLRDDVNLGRALFWHLQDRLPRTATNISWDDTYISVYSRGNPHLSFSMNDFEILIRPRCRGASLIDDSNAWNLINDDTGVVTAQAVLRVSTEAVKRFEVQIRLVLLNSGQTPFEKFVRKWNTQLIALVTYFREAVAGTPELLRIIIKGETKVQTRIKLQLNSKMPKRFPPVVFYAPIDLGGLGMYSMGHVLIAQQDLRISQFMSSGPSHFAAGMTHEQGTEIPNLLRYITPWQDEVRESSRVWKEYAALREEAVKNNRRLGQEVLKDILNLGIPRVGTIFQPDKKVLRYDQGWRLRLEFKKYNLKKAQPLWWTSTRHDGKLHNFDKYKKDVLQAFGGVEAILKHTLFPATGIPNWENLGWLESSRHEEKMKSKKLTDAQARGFTKIPNQRFALWWSPTINRSDTYVGFETQVDMTGIILRAKLSLLKQSFVQIFVNHLWDKIHSSVSDELFQGLRQLKTMSVIHAAEVQRCMTPPRKSYKFNFGCADIELTATNQWQISSPSRMSEDRDVFNQSPSSAFWIDVQLCWGNVDSDDVERYARGKFVAYVNDTTSQYKSSTGVIIAIDLAYNRYAAYGYWFPNFKQTLADLLNKVFKNNSALNMLRDRVKSALRLHGPRTIEKVSSQNLEELFMSKSWIVDGSAICPTVHIRTPEGNTTHKPTNGAVLTVNTHTGKVYLTIVHADAWRGQSRRSALAKLKVAEALDTLLKSLPPEEHPLRIIVARRPDQDAITHRLSGQTNIVIKSCDVRIPYSEMVRRVPKISSLVSTATTSGNVTINLYDDWLEQGINPRTAFYRVVMILRALSKNADRTWAILKPQVNTRTRPDHQWPTHTPEDWAKIEKDLKDLIIADFCKRMNVDSSKLTQTEMLHIVLGIEVQSIQIQQMQAAEQDSRIAELENISSSSNNQKQLVKSTNKFGQEILTISSHAGRMATGKSDWRERALGTIARFQGSTSSAFFIHSQHATARNTISYSFPENSLKMFAACGDVRIRTVGLLYGIHVGNKHREVRCVVFPPQSGTLESVQFPYILPTHPQLQELKLLGVIHNQYGSVAQPSWGHFFTMQQMITYNPTTLDPVTSTTDFVTVALGMDPARGTPELSVFRFLPEGIEYAASIPPHGPVNEDTLPPITSEMFERREIVPVAGRIGFCLIPDDDAWNANFSGVSPAAHERYNLTPGVPKDFYDPCHRKEHFRTFVRFEESDAALNDVDVEDYLS